MNDNQKQFLKDARELLDKYSVERWFIINDALYLISNGCILTIMKSPQSDGLLTIKTSEQINERDDIK